MKKNEVEDGKIYLATVSGKVCRVKIAGPSPYGGWNAKNLDTGRTIRIKSAQRLRRFLKFLTVVQGYDE